MEHKEFGEINIVPLVDVMLVLLTIVLTTATFIVTGEIAVNLPEAKNRDAASISPVVITLTKDGRLFIDKKEVSYPELSRHIRQFNREQPVVIRADEGISVGRFAYVIDVLKGEGFRRVSMEVSER